MANDSPSYQDKEERRLITLASMEFLLKFHEVEKKEKYNAMKFYASFLGGGIALLLGVSKLTSGIEAEILKYLLITMIMAMNFAVVKKLIAVRIASNNIYHEHGRRLRFLLESHSSDLDEKGKSNLEKAFYRYIDEQKQGPILKKGSADTFEIKVFLFVNIMLSFMYWLPINGMLGHLAAVYDCLPVVLFLTHLATVIFFSSHILKGTSDMPNGDAKNQVKND
ncbi:hypothetical protein [Pseudoalteromonas luteoviolacea]|uniref:hypothetical protein n=1 Tax=Pseudoalteromonas luteoviolacea TaxID=43657 RepID=UPI00114E5865|nr:hypothetical protein [Pseudoalteromonas luteoviolacea]TQF70509.1 hypothetical protein FLM44_05280 [Pseudoalteromonas luteoviolacea]